MYRCVRSLTCDKHIQKERCNVLCSFNYAASFDYTVRQYDRERKLFKDDLTY